MSAGMVQIQAQLAELHPHWWTNYIFWNLLHTSFGIERDACQWMKAYLTNNLIDIARDNLVGQCTMGHSCKVMAKADLEGLITSRNTSYSAATTEEHL